MKNSSKRPFGNCCKESDSVTNIIVSIEMLSRVQFYQSFMNINLNLCHLFPLENILLTKNEVVKLCDFGFARIMSGDILYNFILLYFDVP